MTNLSLIRIEDLEDTRKLIEFCKTAYTEVSQPASKNMWADGWQTQPHTLFYKLYVEKLFSGDNGMFNLLLDGDTIVACSGVYCADNIPGMALAGARTWISPEYRHKKVARDYFLPAHRVWAVEQGLGAIAITFNDYNKNIITTWKRVRAGEAGRPKRQPHHLFYHEMIELSFPVTIQYTKQWIVYERLDPNWDFDWDIIK